MTAKSVSKICSVEGCKNPYLAKDLCITHYQRRQKYGTVDLPSTKLDRTMSYEAKFWSRVAITANPEKCWRWLNSEQGSGYGTFMYHGIKIRSHRLAYLLTKGEIPEGMVIMHLCDNRMCVNPAHLEAGTTRDNVRDMYKKGRAAYKGPRGPQNPNVKLTKDVIPDIRARLARGEMLNDIAARYGVKRTAIRYIKIGKTWAYA